MIEIDGSTGEGGGALLRIALALSAVCGSPIRIYNIRAKRDNPGLQHQHLSSVNVMASLCGAKVDGARLNSTELVFEPGRIRGGKYRVNIGTAGSTTLLLQPVMIASAFADGPVEVEVTGGTDNPKAPPIDYLKNVTVPMLGRFGYSVDVTCVLRGHYPRGGGRVVARMEPVGVLKPLVAVERGRILGIRGVAHCVRLPEHVARRMAHSASVRLMREGYSDVKIKAEHYPPERDSHLGPGAGITIWAETDTGCILGASALGEPGKPAESVGTEAADKLIKTLETGCAIDRYLADQLVPYMGIAEGLSEITCAELSKHTITNVWLVEKILGIGFEVRGGEGCSGRLIVRGTGLKKGENPQHDED
jgi:RNA 3'-phosphate cyclase